MRHQLVRLLVGCLLLCVATVPAIGQTLREARWIGPWYGAWTDPANWDIGIVPFNDEETHYRVIIEGYNRPCRLFGRSGEISELVIDERLEITGSELRILKRLTLVSGDLIVEEGGRFIGPALVDVGIVGLHAYDEGTRIDIPAPLSKAFCHATRGAIIELPAVRSLVGGQLAAASGATILLPALETIEGTVDLGLASEARIEMPRLQSAGGSAFSPRLDISVSATAVLDLPSLTSLSSTISCAGVGSTIRFPNLTRFYGVVNLRRGAQMHLPVRELYDSDIEAGEDSVLRVDCEVVGATGRGGAIQLRARNGGRLELPNLVATDIPAHLDGSIQFSATYEGATLNAPVLQESRSTTQLIANDGTLSLPALRLTGEGHAIIGVPNGRLEVPRLINFNHFRIEVTGQGGEYRTIFREYSFRVDEDTISGVIALSAHAGGGYINRFNLDSVEVLDMRFDADHAPFPGETVEISARDRGRLTLRGLRQLLAPYDPKHQLHFAAWNFSTIEFPAIVIPNNVSVSSADASTSEDSRVVVHGDLTFEPDASLGGNAQLIVHGNLSMMQREEPGRRFRVNSLSLELSGRERVTLEVASNHRGIEGPTTGNYGFKQVTVGDGLAPTTVTLVDEHVNAGGGGPEVFYVGELLLRPGCRFVIGPFEAFAVIGGVPTPLRGLFGPGEWTIPFGDGELMLRECAADLTGDGLLDVFDFLAFLDLYAAGDPQADFTGDGVLDFLDLLAFQDAYGRGCA